MKSLFVLAAMMAAATAQLPNNDRGPTAPIVPLDCSDPLQFAADAQNQCWYYQCTPQGVKPRPCALGTHVHFLTTVTRFNPCTERFHIQAMFDCTRRNDSVCDKSLLNCQNGGVAMSEGSLCWCDCPLAWQGSPDCSSATKPTQPRVFSTCPPVNWCFNAFTDHRNPCRNNGTCVNQCTNFVCDCPRPFAKDPLCSEFTCGPMDTCPTGQSCRRGVNGRDEFYTCV